MTAIDIHSGHGLFVGYRSGKARFFDLEKAKSILEFGGDESEQNMSGVTHLMSIAPGVNR